MPPVTRRSLASALAAFVVIAGATLFVAIPANAQTERSAVCVDRMELYYSQPEARSSQQLQTWMNQQILSGKTQFVTADKDSVLCAW